MDTIITMTTGQLVGTLAAISAVVALVTYNIASRPRSAFGMSRGEGVPNSNWSTGSGDGDVFGVGMKTFRRGCVRGERLEAAKKQEAREQRGALAAA